MPVRYLRALTDRSRTPDADRHLAFYLTFIAGAVNAGGFLVVGQYTSHMSGIVSAIADNLVLGELALVVGGVSAVLAFLTGAALSAWLVNWGRRHDSRGLYALPLFVEGTLLLLFALIGRYLEVRLWLLVPATVALLCFLMGVQNAMITKLSRAEIRTTHVTGLITDIGIEIGKLLYWNRDPAFDARFRVRADVPRLFLLVGLVLTFFAGGVAGGFGFKEIGLGAAIPLALALFLLAIVPLHDDWTARNA